MYQQNKQGGSLCSTTDRLGRWWYMPSFCLPHTNPIPYSVLTLQTVSLREEPHLCCWLQTLQSPAMPSCLHQYCVIEWTCYLERLTSRKDRSGDMLYTPSPPGAQVDFLDQVSPPRHFSSINLVPHGIIYPELLCDVQHWHFSTPSWKSHVELALAFTNQIRSTVSQLSFLWSPRIETDLREFNGEGSNRRKTFVLKNWHVSSFLFNILTSIYHFPICANN